MKEKKCPCSKKKPEKRYVRIYSERVGFGKELATTVDFNRREICVDKIEDFGIKSVANLTIKFCPLCGKELLPSEQKD